VNLKIVLSKIDTYSDKLLHGRSSYSWPSAAAPWHYDAVEVRPFSNRLSFVNAFLSLPRVTVLSAVGIIRRNIWSEAQVLQCPQRAGMR
jgi:hypothetical protein